MPHSLMLVSSQFTDDPRVSAEAAALAEAGWAVTVIAWDRSGNARSAEWKPGLRVIWSGVRSGVAMGIRQVFKIPRFWLDSIRTALRFEIDVVHAHDLDTLPAGYIISRLKRVPLVYDAHESYPDQHVGRLPAAAVASLRMLERWLIRRTSAVITVGGRLARSLQERGAGRIEIIGNWKDGDEFSFTPDEIAELRRRYGVDGFALTIGYAGGFFPFRMLPRLIEALRAFPQIGLVLAGDGSDRTNIEKAIEGMPNVRYLGLIPSSQIPEVTAVCDVLYYCLDSSVPNSYYSAPNKLFEAMAGGKAMLSVRNVGEIGEIVEATGMGCLIEEPSPAELSRALRRLLDRTELERWQANSVRAYRESYNWHAARERLLALYGTLA